MSRRCSFPLWPTLGRLPPASERRFCDRPVVDPRAKGLARSWCGLCLRVVRRQPDEAVHVHDAKRQAWGGALLATSKAKPVKPKAPLPEKPRIAARPPQAKNQVARIPTPTASTWSRAPVTLDESEIRRLRGEGESIVAIAARFGCGRSSIMRAIRRLDLPSGAEFVATRQAA